MESLYLLIPISVVLVFAIGVAFWWSVRSGQFDDLEGPAYRILMEGEPEVKEVRGQAGSSSEGKDQGGGK